MGLILITFLIFIAFILGCITGAYFIMIGDYLADGYLSMGKWVEF